MKKLTTALVVCVLLVAPVCLGQNTGGDKAAEGGKKAHKGKKELAAKSADIPQDQRLKAIWEPINYAEDVELNDVFFVTDQEGWIAGGKDALHGGVILHTSDGGDHWDVQVGDP